VAAPLPSPTTKYGAIFAATPGSPTYLWRGGSRRAGANFPHFFVARRSKIPDIRHSSIRELRKLAPSAARGKVNNRL
jgi:hypothetical protein